MSEETWNIYSTSSSNNSSTASQVKDDPFMTSFDSSMNAISLGFVATALLISMFLIMAILEHLFRANGSSSSDDDNRMGSRETILKLGNQEMVQTSHASVVMPGQRYPTFIAQPAPLSPCPREGVRWPFHI